jgi:hypothetical protein
MATVRTYFTVLRDLANQLGLALGSNLTTLPKDARVGDAASLAAVAILCKALTDNGVLTDAQLQAAVAVAKSETWPDEPFDPPPNPV